MLATIAYQRGLNHTSDVTTVSRYRSRTAWCSSSAITQADKTGSLSLRVSSQTSEIIGAERRAHVFIPFHLSRYPERWPSNERKRKRKKRRSRKGQRKRVLFQPRYLFPYPVRLFTSFATGASGIWVIRFLFRQRRKKKGKNVVGCTLSLV